MSRLSARLRKLENQNPATNQIYRLRVFRNTREIVDAQIAAEEADAKAAGESLMAIIMVPHKDQTMNEFREANGLAPLATPEWDEL